MEIDIFDYYLPKELIAQEPLKERDKARLLVLYKDSGKIEHKFFYELPYFLEEGDLLVLNNTKVIKAKLILTLDTGGKLEALLIRGNKNLIEIKAKKAKKLKEGREIYFKDGTKGVVKKVLDEGKRLIEIKDVENYIDFIDKVGDVPLPPYIKNKNINEDDYQTIFGEYLGSIAAPTAGLHFTENLINKLKEKGVKIEYVTLHVSTPTFEPIKEKSLDKVKLGEEWIEVNEKVLNEIKSTKLNKKRIIAVGTTVVRTLETVARIEGIKEYKGTTDLFIKPPFEFKFVDALITNFHLPKTTLLVLVCAFGGIENVLNAYKVAINERYRFYSFGDAMLII
ncbi:MAG: tRNA preQ1(34) S-adenosylmethionine ribosyltransferase-isomerase QueA [Caldisericia bacterium]|nr:tRNA preQ1(34) S-adenosylmethionine ribosyltransferase-isomerase QueA [Caldisericia bacterium]